MRIGSCRVLAMFDGMDVVCGIVCDSLNAHITITKIPFKVHFHFIPTYPHCFKQATTMNKDAEIREYDPKYQRQFKQFYLDMEYKKRTSRVLHALRQRSSAKLSWQAGLVGILGIHLSQYSFLSAKHTMLLMVELLLWSAGIGVLWFKKIGQEYDDELNKTCQHMASELAAIRKSEKSNAWIMVKQGQIVGTVAFKHETGEGKIGYLTGIDPQIRLLLLKNAFRFGRTINIDIISKWKHDMKWSESAL